MREAVANEDPGGGKARKRRKNGGAEGLPEVSRVEVEEVGWLGEEVRKNFSSFREKKNENKKNKQTSSNSPTTNDVNEVFFNRI